MQTVDTNLSVMAIVECPNEGCSNDIDLFEIEYLTDEGWLINELLSNNGFGCKDLGKEIECEVCKTIFKIGNVVW
ncbi:MAG: hypothetical protein ACUZ8H_03625 [Candidatus Anammoxibacter sp.]